MKDVLLVIELTNRCNLHCRYCCRAGRGMITESDLFYTTLVELVDEAMKLGVCNICLSGGEPFLHDNILAIIKKLLKTEIRISIVSNGTLITQALAEELKEIGAIPFLQIGFDSYDASIHNLTRGGFYKTLNGFLRLVEAVNDIEASPAIRIVVNRYNYLELDKIICFFSRFTKRFHLIHDLQQGKLWLEPGERRHFEKNMMPQLRRIVEEKKVVLHMSDSQEKMAVSSFVIGANCQVYSSGMGNPCVGEWTGKGSLIKLFNQK